MRFRLASLSLIGFAMSVSAQEAVDAPVDPATENPLTIKIAPPDARPPDATSDKKDSSDLAGFLAVLLGEEPKTEEEIDAAAEKASAYPLGSAENPVRADGPSGQRAYLSRLRCEDLSQPSFERLGSTGASPYGGILDIYEVRCEGGEPQVSKVYMDMYHASYREEKAVSGFGIMGGVQKK